MVESEQAGSGRLRRYEGKGCSGCDGHSEDARVTVNTGFISNAQWKWMIVTNDVTSVRAVSMNATCTVVVTGWLESWMQFKSRCRKMMLRKRFRFIKNM
jgi:hypothetical protein